MALQGHEGFDHQNNATDLVNDVASATRPWQWSIMNNVSLTAGTNFFNYGKCLLFSPSGGSTNLTLTTPIVTHIIGLHCFIPAGQTFSILWYDSSTQGPFELGGTGQIGIACNATTGAVSLYSAPGVANRPGTLLAATSNNVFAAATTFFLEIEVTIATGTGGSVVVKVNGTTVSTGSFSGINTAPGTNTNFDSIIFGNMFGQNTAAAVELDNLYLEDTTGSAPFNTFLTSAGGIPRVYTLFPSANSSVTWTPLAGTNWQEVSETAMDGDTSYNSSNSIGQTDLFSTPGIPATLTPLAVQLELAVRQDAAGPRASQTALKSGVAATVFGASIANNQTYAYQRDLWTADPATSGSWTRSGVNAALIGYKTSA